MIARIIELSARNRMVILLMTAVLVAVGIWAVINTPLDAIPDLSDPQVIVYTEYGGAAPQVVEDQITYPLTTALLAVPKSKVVRGFSFFGVSFVYVVFEEGTDIYCHPVAALRPAVAGRGAVHAGGCHCRPRGDGRAEVVVRPAARERQRERAAHRDKAPCARAHRSILSRTRRRIAQVYFVLSSRITLVLLRVSPTLVT